MKKIVIVALPLLAVVLVALFSYMQAYHWYNYIDVGVRCNASQCVDVYQHMTGIDRFYTWAVTFLMLAGVPALLGAIWYGLYHYGKRPARQVIVSLEDCPKCHHFHVSQHCPSYALAE